MIWIVTRSIDQRPSPKCQQTVRHRSLRAMQWEWHGNHCSKLISSCTSRVYQALLTTITAWATKTQRAPARTQTTWLQYSAKGPTRSSPAIVPVQKSSNVNMPLSDSSAICVSNSRQTLTISHSRKHHTKCTRRRVPVLFWWLASYLQSRFKEKNLWDPEESSLWDPKKRGLRDPKGRVCDIQRKGVYEIQRKRDCEIQRKGIYEIQGNEFVRSKKKVFESSKGRCLLAVTNDEARLEIHIRGISIV